MPVALSLPKISTNVRLAAARWVAPAYAGALAERLFLTPPRPRLEATALDLIDARSSQIEHRGRRIALWEWGWKSREAPAVLLAHGWGGSAAQMRAFAFPLLAAGFRVVTFDQPAHGLSEGRLTSAVDFADVLAALARAVGRVQAVIAHSLGAAAAAYAVARGLPLESLVLVSPPADFVGYSHRFARWHWLPEPVRRSMQAAIEERYGVRWEELEIERLGARVSGRALVVHDRGDTVVPWRHGLRVAKAWPGGRFMLTSGFGHGRLLREDAVVLAAADFIAGKSAVANIATAAYPSPLY